MEFGLYTGFSEFLTNLAVIYFFINPYIWEWSGTQIDKWGYDGTSEVYRTMLCFGIQTLVGLIENVPKTLYQKFVIDERHGFNKMTIGLFISDTIKQTLLSLLFGAPIIALLIKIMQWGGPNFYIYVFVFLVILIFLLMWIVPNFIMPLFNKYEDIEDGSLKT